MTGQTESIVLGPFQLDLASPRVLRDGKELDVRPQAFRILKLLMQNQGSLVEYKQIIQEAWGGTQVSNHTVAVTIGEIKTLLGEYGSWITCRPKFGYRLEMHGSEDLLRRGWHFWNQYTRQGFENALRCFHQAAENDGGDFRAYEAIASTHLMLAGFLMKPPRDLYQSFLEAHNRAVSLCGATPELIVDRAFGRCVFERNAKAAEAELLAVQPKRPHYVHVHVRLALVYAASKRIDDALAVMQRAKAADPLAPELAFLEIVLNLFSRNFQAAVEAGKRSLDLHPGPQVGRAFYAEALDLSGQTAEALAQYDLAATISRDTPWIRANQARCLALHGRRTEALRILDELEQARKTDYVDGYHMATLLDALGRRDQAFAELERAFDENSYALLFAASDPKADSLRADPRFELLQSRVRQ